MCYKLESRKNWFKGILMVAKPKKAKSTATTAKKVSVAKPKPTAKKAPASKASVTKAPVSAAMQYKFEAYQPEENEVYMNDTQVHHFRAMLEAWKKDLMQEVDNTLSEMKEASVMVLADPNDRATQEETFNLELRTRDRERKLIRKIEQTLQRIDDKEYGYCESCGVEIGIRRLEARPTAVLCIDCKTLDEIREKRTSQ
jgi:DnaK suppressor protein